MDNFITNTKIKIFKFCFLVVFGALFLAFSFINGGLFKTVEAATYYQCCGGSCSSCQYELDPYLNTCTKGCSIYYSSKDCKDSCHATYKCVDRDCTTGIGRCVLDDDGNLSYSECRSCCEKKEAEVDHYRGWKCVKTGCSDVPKRMDWHFELDYWSDPEYCYDCMWSRWWTSDVGVYKSREDCRADCQTKKCQCSPYVEPAEYEPPFPYYTCNRKTGKCEADPVGGIFSTRGTCLHWCSRRIDNFNIEIRGWECNLSTYTCEYGWDGMFSSKQSCEGRCKPPPPRYKCDTENLTCIEDSYGVYASLSSCQSDCTNKCSCKECPSSGPCEKECVVNTDCNITPTTPPPTTTPPTTPPTTIPPLCVIDKFELPKRAWVDIETIASWSTNNCDTAEINCISDDCIEGVEDLSGEVSVGFDQKKNFTIKAPGTYRYELVACIGPIPADPHNDEEHCDVYEDTLGTGLEYIEIEVLYLPWWQEIIPVLPDNLQGFLRGLIN